MAINSGGYQGKFTDAQWAMQAPFHGFGRYAVRNITSLVVVADPTHDRGVIVKAGVAYGDGIIDEVTEDVPLTFVPAAAGYSRYGVVVIRRDWGAKTSTLMTILGSQLPVYPIYVKTEAGVLADQVLAMVKITGGSATVTDIRDRRCWVEGKRSFIGIRYGQDDFAIPGTGQFAGLSELAPAGQYALSGQIAHQASGAFIGGYGFDVGGIALAGTTFSVGYGQRTESCSDLYLHPGGVLSIGLKASFGGSPGVVSSLPGSRVVATWVAPFA